MTRAGQTEVHAEEARTLAEKRERPLPPSAAAFLASASEPASGQAWAPAWAPAAGPPSPSPAPAGTAAGGRGAQPPDAVRGRPEPPRRAAARTPAGGVPPSASARSDTTGRAVNGATAEVPA